MQISSDQCRAARGLLSWTQEQLAVNARVSRATVADFEARARSPMKNNLLAIEDCLYAAGVEFLSEEGKTGVGVRFRKPKLEYTKNVKVNRFDRQATMQMRYAGEDFKCVIGLNLIDDYYHKSYQTDEEFTSAIGEMLHTILTVVECQIEAEIRCKDTAVIENGYFFVTDNMLDPNKR